MLVSDPIKSGKKMERLGNWAFVIVITSALWPAIVTTIALVFVKIRYKVLIWIASVVAGYLFMFLAQHAIYSVVDPMDWNLLEEEARAFRIKYFPVLVYVVCNLIAPIVTTGVIVWWQVKKSAT